MDFSTFWIVDFKVTRAILSTNRMKIAKQPRIYSHSKGAKEAIILKFKQLFTMLIQKTFSTVLKNITSCRKSVDPNCRHGQTVCNGRQSTCINRFAIFQSIGEARTSLRLDALQKILLVFLMIDSLVCPKQIF